MERTNIRDWDQEQRRPQKKATTKKATARQAAKIVPIITLAFGCQGRAVANEKLSSSRDNGQERMEAGEKGSVKVGCCKARSKSIFAVYTIPASTPAGSSISSQ